MACEHGPYSWEDCGACIDALSGNGNLRAKVEKLKARGERLEKALKEIHAGRTHGDYEHPLGESASMAGRFMRIARAALSDKDGDT